MNRILGTVVALAAVLAFGTVSHAAPITFNLAGSTLQTGSSLAPPPGYFTTPFSPGSSLTINPDTNGDGLTGQAGDVSLLGGTLVINGVTNLGAYGTFISATTVTLTGGTGTLTGTSLLWNTDTGTSTAGTFGCTGAICGLIGITEGVVYPISVYQAFVAAQGVTALNPLSLGPMNFVFSGPSGTLDSTGLAVSAIVAATGGPASWDTFHGVPEPSAFVLVLLGLGAVALRSRKA